MKYHYRLNTYDPTKSILVINNFALLILRTSDGYLVIIFMYFINNINLIFIMTFCLNIML